MCTKKIFNNLSFIVLIGFSIGTIANELTLAEAERLALDADFIIKQYNTRADSLNEIAIAEEQLPDPKAKLGVMNIPINSFDRSQEAMTQLQFGVQQTFPRGDTLHYKRLRIENMADVDTAKAFEQEKKVLRSLRNSYLDLYLNEKTELILQENRSLFTQLLDITQRQYAVGRDNQHDVLRAQLELALIDDRIAEIVGAKEISLAELSKWIGNNSAQRPLREGFPELSSFMNVEEIITNLNYHPMILMEDAVVNANEKNIKIAEEQYKPGWMLDLTYGQRSGNNLDGSSRDDFASAMVMVDIPLFTDKRQDKRLSASKLDHQASQFARTDRLLELRRQVEKEHANWVRLGKRLELYKTRALVDAEQNSEATLKAYQNDLTDFTTLMRARLTELNTHLDMLKIRVDRAKSQANLLYYVRETI
ncbi:MAG: copper transporter [marine bacterium B5-7]|nr:MAG: copper transporter [marine bacterium B5-7]